MNNCRNITKLFHNLLIVLFKYWAVFLVGSSVFLILIVTLYPYTFISQDHLSLIVVQQFRQSLNLTTDIYDTIANILLFSSLGFGLAGIFYKQFLGWRFIVILSLIISASLSLTIETLQLFLPTRTSSVLDLLTNITGGFFGTVAFYFWKSFAVKFLVKRCLTKSRLIFIAIGYTTLVFCLIFSLHRSNNLSNWDYSFPLLVGNESTGDRPWNGMMSQIYFANRSLSTAEITQALTKKPVRDLSIWTTAYQLTGKDDYLDLNGFSPNLKWRGFPRNRQNQEMISLSQKHWLSTLEPVTKLIQSIRQTSQFSLLTTVATSDIHQSGPARIISLSANPSLRNLTIGQQGSRLIVRLRTPLSGAGKSNTNLAFSGIFTDTNVHRLLLNFNRDTLQLFVDNSQKNYVIKLSPAILFAHLLPAIGIRNLQITPSNGWILQLVFYSLILSLPTALLLLKFYQSY